MDRKLTEARKIAKNKGIKNWDTLEISKAKNKRFSIITPKGKKINFGLFPFQNGTFLDHGNEQIKDAWLARHSRIFLKDGSKAIMNPESPDYYSSRILWS
jgi:hypothetical protein